MLWGPVLSLEEAVLSERRVVCIQRDLCKSKPITSFLPTSTSPKDTFSNSKQNKKFSEIRRLPTFAASLFYNSPCHTLSHLCFCLFCSFCLECRSPYSLPFCGEVLVGPLRSSPLVSLPVTSIGWVALSFFGSCTYHSYSTALQLFDLCLSFPLVNLWISWGQDLFSFSA